MIRIYRGIPEGMTEAAAALVADAFRRKLRVPLGDARRTRAFLSRVIVPDHVLCALADDGRLIGVAGLKTAAGGLVGGRLGDLAAVYGWPAALWRGAILLLLDSPAEPDSLQLDSICVARDARGRGVGTALLDAVAAEATRRGLPYVSLDVVDENPKARALYERQGFRATGITRMGMLAPLFGFRSVVRMRRAAGPATQP